jgi:glycogen operon protein
LRQSRFLTAQWNDDLGVKDCTWLTPAAAEMTPDNWSDGNARCFGVLLDGRAQQSGIRKRGSEATLLMIFNAHHDVVAFKFPELVGGRDWQRLIDTNLPEKDEDPEDVVRFTFGQDYEVTGRSLLLFLLRPERSLRDPKV